MSAIARVTVDVDPGHTDVSLWFVLALRRDAQVSRRSGRVPLGPDGIRSTDTGAFDPALGRSLAKVTP